MFNFFGFWEIVLNPAFLITFGLTALPFAFLGLSVWTTWQENEKKQLQARRRR